MAHRTKALPGLSSRTQNFFKVVMEGIPWKEPLDAKFPEDVMTWIASDYEIGKDTLLMQKLELFLRKDVRITGANVDIMKIFTDHQYIALKDYRTYLDTLGGPHSFPSEKVSNILLLSNLSRLLASLIEITAEYPEYTPEERALQVSQIALLFPNQFMDMDTHRGTEEAKILLDLRTQIFVQTFLETVGGNDWDEWDTNKKIGEIFQFEDDSLSTAQANSQSPRVMLL